MKKSHVIFAVACGLLSCIVECLLAYWLGTPLAAFLSEYGNWIWVIFIAALAIRFWIDRSDE